MSSYHATCMQGKDGQRRNKHHLLGSLSIRVFEMRTATGREHFLCQDSSVSQIFNLMISNGGKILININVVVYRQVQMENRSLPVAVRVSKTCLVSISINVYLICYQMKSNLHNYGKIPWKYGSETGTGTLIRRQHCVVIFLIHVVLPRNLEIP